MSFYDLTYVMVWKYINFTTGEEGCAHFINYWSDSKPYSLLFKHGNSYEIYHENFTNIWGPPRGFVEKEIEISYYKIYSNNHPLNVQGQKNKKKKKKKKKGNNNQNNKNNSFHLVLNILNGGIVKTTINHLFHLPLLHRPIILRILVLGEDINLHLVQIPIAIILNLNLHILIKSIIKEAMSENKIIKLIKTMRAPGERNILPFH